MMIVTPPRVWARLVSAMGGETRTCGDGLTAIEAAQSFSPTIVLLDIGLPGMNGFQVAQELRERSETREAMLVALTGYGGNDERERSRAAGFDHHLVKPIRLESLRRVARAMCQFGRRPCRLAAVAVGWAPAPRDEAHAVCFVVLSAAKHLPSRYEIRRFAQNDPPL